MNVFSNALSSIRKFVFSRQPYQTTAAFGFGIFLGIIPNWIVAGGNDVVWIVGILTVVSWLLSVILPKASEFDVIIKLPQTIRNQQDEKLYARKGFIGFVPLFTPKRGTPASELSISERLDAVTNLDFDLLGVEDSNFAPTIKAICSHKEEIEHCWLLTTIGTNPDAKGSLVYVKLLAEYLKQKKGIQCRYYYDENGIAKNYSVSLDEDSQVMGKIYDLVQSVFKESKNQQLSAREIVADISTGFRSMTLGMVLACLDEERDIEFVGTHYNADGKPDGSLTPIIFSFEPKSKLEQA